MTNVRERRKTKENLANALKKKISTLEGKQSLMWITATSPPLPLTSISFILIRVLRVLSSRPCGTTLHVFWRETFVSRQQ